MRRVRIPLRLLGAVVVLAALVALPLTASAHEEIDSGDYHFEIGWVNEPVVLGQRNGLDLFVATKDDPEVGLADISTLTFTVEYGGVNKSFDIVPVEGEDGHYIAPFVPTRQGQYTFHITGSIQGESIDVSVEPEEVITPDSVSFPESLASAAEMTAQIETAQGQMRTAKTFGIVGIVLGLIGTGLGAGALLRRRS
jgi:hypothetical protein